MKILLDSCMSPGARDMLQAAGHETVWAGEWPQDPGDQQILEMVYQQGRVLITLDKDFGELALLRGASHCGVLRLANFRAKDQGPVCLRVLAGHGGGSYQSLINEALAKHVAAAKEPLESTLRRVIREELRKTG